MRYRLKAIIAIVLVVPTLFFLIWISAVGLAPWSEHPGVGKKSEAGYRLLSPVIAALENFKKEKMHYPQNLNELVPKYLSSEPSTDSAGLVAGINYYPEREDPSSPAIEDFVKDNGHYPDSLHELVPKYLACDPLKSEIDQSPQCKNLNYNYYTLEFRYYGPGVNHCYYESTTLQWHCNGTF